MKSSSSSWLSLSTVAAAVVVGQVLSLILSSTNIFVSLMMDVGADPFLLPIELVYHALFVVVVATSAPKLIKIYRGVAPPIVAGYIALGLVDFAANATVLLSFAYTSAVSVMVITSTSVVFAMIMAVVVFGRSYSRVHLAGAAIVVVGLVLINFSRYRLDHDGVHWTGSLLALAAAFLYALSNTLNEFVARSEKGYPIGAIAAMATVGSVASLVVCQLTPIGIADRDEILAASFMALVFLGLFVASMVCLYVAVPIYVQRFSAVHLNFSLLTSDVFVLVFNLVWRPEAAAILCPWYMAGFVGVVGGLFVFNLAEDPEPAKLCASSPSRRSAPSSFNYQL